MNEVEADCEVDAENSDALLLVLIFADLPDDQTLPLGLLYAFGSPTDCVILNFHPYRTDNTTMSRTTLYIRSGGNKCTS